MTTFLLDTHVFIWTVAEPERLSERSRAVILDPRNTLMLSTASVWEALLKARKGKLAYFGNALPAEDMERFLRQLNILPLPVGMEHVSRSSTLPDIHADPFDRLIVAQALVEGVPLVTADESLRGYPVRIVW